MVEGRQSTRKVRWRARPPSPFCVVMGTLLAVIVIGLLLAFGCVLCRPAHGRDLEGRYANNPLKPWFDSLHSGYGNCCSVADGRETEYDIRNGKYWVPVNGKWTEVPDAALITEPNKFGRAMVWLMLVDGKSAIRCFIPGSGL